MLDQSTGKGWLTDEQGAAAARAMLESLMPVKMGLLRSTTRTRLRQCRQVASAREVASV